MTLDREIILDLLPLYRSGLASEPSRRLVEAWLREHEAEIKESRDRPADPSGITLLARARRLRRWQRRLYGLAIGCTVLCFSSEFHIVGGRLVSARLLAVDHPLLFAPLILAAIGCWTGYALLRSRLR